MKNPYISFYGMHKISPVHQNIEDLRLHLRRREKLYRILGMPSLIFKGKTVLEVGPGGGYNALAMFHWGVKRIDFIEPNLKAREELPRLLAEHGIKKDRWILFPRKIEGFPGAEKYDIIIAEGFIPGLCNRKGVITTLSRLVKKGGIVVVTCVDDLSFLPELIKRIVGMRLLQINKVSGFDQKVKALSLAFSSHLKSLKFSSRPVSDWVTDQFFNPALYGKFFNIAECIKEFGDGFIPLGVSPSIFTDCSWYKDTEFDSRKSMRNQFYAKRHLLLSKDMEESIRPIEENEDLVKTVRKLRLFAGKVEHDLNCKNTARIITMMRDIGKRTREIDKKIFDAIEEAVSLITDDNLTISGIANAKHFARLFGRGQQYVSLVKRTYED